MKYIFIIIICLICILLFYNRIETFDIEYQIKHNNKCLSNKNLIKESCDKSDTIWLVNDFNMILSKNDMKCLKQNDSCVILESTDNDQYIQSNGNVLNENGKWIKSSTALQDQLYKLSQLTLK